MAIYVLSSSFFSLVISSFTFRLIAESYSYSGRKVYNLILKKKLIEQIKTKKSLVNTFMEMCLRE